MRTTRVYSRVCHFWKLLNVWCRQTTQYLFWWSFQWNISWISSKKVFFRLDKTCLFWFPVVTTALLLLKGKGPIQETRYVIWHGMQGFSYCEGGTRKKVSLVHSTKMIFLSLQFVWSRQRLKVTKKVTAFFTLFYYLKEVPSLHIYIATFFLSTDLFSKLFHLPWNCFYLTLFSSLQCS